MEELGYKKARNRNFSTIKDYGVKNMLDLIGDLTFVWSRFSRVKPKPNKDNIH